MNISSVSRTIIANTSHLPALCLDIAEENKYQSLKKQLRTKRIKRLNSDPEISFHAIRKPRIGGPPIYPLHTSLQLLCFTLQRTALYFPPIV
jgi:hypothetical protein